VSRFCTRTWASAGRLRNSYVKALHTRGCSWRVSHGHPRFVSSGNCSLIATANRKTVRSACPPAICLAASKQRLHYGRSRNRPVLVSAPRRVSGACAVSRDGSHTGGTPLPTDLQFPTRARYTKCSTFGKTVLHTYDPNLRVMVRKFGWHPAFGSGILPSQGRRDWRCKFSENPAAASGGALGDRLQTIAVTVGDFGSVR
jgi:hypothetical protein